MSYVYFIQSREGPIKIGYSTDPKRRIASIDSANHSDLEVIGIVRGTEELEAQIHADLSRYRKCGEWFEPTSGLLEYIQNILGELGSVDLSQTRRRLKIPKHEEEARDAAVHAATEMILMEWRNGVTTEKAISLVAKRTGLPKSEVWALRYRPPTRVTAGVYLALAKAWPEAIDDELERLAQSKVWIQKVKRGEA